MFDTVASSNGSLEEIALLSTPGIDQINRRLLADFEHMATELRGLPLTALNSRLRHYDGYQRLTFGRAPTAMMSAGAIFQENFEFAFESQRLTASIDASRFLSPLIPENYPGLWFAIAHSARLLVTPDMHGDLVVVSVFCHRVLIRPGESYRGFTHRDLAPVGGRIGTVIWYPRVDAHKVLGAQLVVYNVEPAVSLEEVGGRRPDRVFEPYQYRGKVLLLPYPKNYPHGVQPARNPLRTDVLGETSVRDFVEPNGSDFIKDIFILAVSDRSPVED
jgi:hypothetical protein